MNVEEVKVAPELRLKPNKFFSETGIPWLYQKRASLIMFARSRMILGDDVGLGKSHPAGTGVLTPNGYVPVQELRPGDRVIGSSGRAVTVRAVYQRGKLPTLRVTFDDGSSVLVGQDHLWAVRTETNARRGKPYEVKETRQLQMDLRHSKHGQAKWRIPLTGPVEFDSKAMDVPAYLLGVWLGDGSGCAFLAHDTSRVPEEVRKVTPEGWVITKCEPKDRVPVYRIKGEEFGKNPFTDFLRRVGLEGATSESKFIPEEVLLSSVGDRVDLLQGLLDTDGEVRDDSVRYHTVSKVLAEQVVFLVQSLGGVARLTSRVGKIGDKEYQRCYCVNVNLQGFRLVRAKEQPKERVKYKASRVMVDISEEGEDEHFCISVDADDHLYLTEDFIVTHNTLESIIAFSYMKSRDPDLKLVVFTEKSSLIQWKDEIRWLCPSLVAEVVTAETHVVAADRRSKLEDSRRDILITSYYTVYNFLESMMRGLGDKYVVFADECNYFKNSDTKMFKQMRTLCDGAQRAYGLSATIIENRLEEAYCILRVIAPGIIPSRAYFDRNFCIKQRRQRDSSDSSKKKSITKVVGYKNIPAFRKLIEPVFYGRFQTDPEVEQELPEDIHKNVPIMMGVEQSKKYLEAEMRIFQTAEGEFVRLGVLQSLTMCQMMAGSPELKGFDIPSSKEEALVENLTSSLSGEKVIVFSKFRQQIERLERLLAAAGVETLSITGDKTTEERNAAKMSFLDPEGVKVLLMTRAGQKALNLQSGGHLIMFDMPWSYGMYRQLVGRLKRTGSKHKRIGIYRYMSVLHPSVAQGSSIETIDHHTLSVLMKKKALFNAVFEDETTIETSDEDLSQIYNLIIKTRGLHDKEVSAGL